MEGISKNAPADPAPRFFGYGLCEMVRYTAKTNRWRYYSVAVMPGLFGTILQRQWCRQGFKPRVKEDEYEDLEEAVRIANLIYRAKTKIGYKEERKGGRPT